MITLTHSALMGAHIPDEKWLRRRTRRREQMPVQERRCAARASTHWRAPSGPARQVLTSLNGVPLDGKPLELAFVGGPARAAPAPARVA
jgi:hypothetical protein